MKAEWIKSQISEMNDIWRRGVFQKVLRSSITSQDRVRRASRAVSITRLSKRGETSTSVKYAWFSMGNTCAEKAKKVSAITSLIPVPAANGFQTILSLATLQNMFTDHVDISQAFVQVELLPRDGHNGKVYIFSLPEHDADPLYVYRLFKPLYGTAARA